MVLYVLLALLMETKSISIKSRYFYQITATSSKFTVIGCSFVSRAIGWSVKMVKFLILWAFSKVISNYENIIDLKSD